MGYHTLPPEDQRWEERPGPEGLPPRLSADVTVPAGLTQSRARVWRYPPGAQGRRHLDRGQEEVFVVLAGTLTMLLGEPAERVEVGARGLVAVERGTPLQVRNEGEEELVLFVYGAPPVTGESEFLEDVSIS